MGVDMICKHDINVFINRQLIYNYPEQLFADAGVMAIEHADFDGIERLALVTGGEIASTFGNSQLVKIGHCKVIEEKNDWRGKDDSLFRLREKRGLHHRPSWSHPTDPGRGR